MNSPVHTSSRTFIETVLVLLLLLALMLALYDVLRVFFGVFTFALIFSVSFATPFERFARVLKNKRKLAAFLYSLFLIAVIALPFIYIISAMSHHIKDAGHWVADVKENGLPPLPSWIAGLPYIGNEISLSVNTISTYRTRILEKLSLNNNAELTRYAFDHGLV